MKNRKARFFIFACSFVFCILAFCLYGDAQNDLSPSQKAPSRAQTSYNLAITSYQRLKYLEENQLWEEYFDKGNQYRQDIVKGCREAIAAAGPDEPLSISARLLLWQFYAGQDDPLAAEALKELENAALAYAGSSAPAPQVKEAADKLEAAGKKPAAGRLYKAYAGKLIADASDPEELKNLAQDFYSQGKAGLSAEFFDAYLEKLSASGGKEKALSEMKDIARAFSYKDQGTCDPLYAEKIFGRIKASGGKGALGQELNYLRAYNLEKSKEFIRAGDAYLEFLKDHPAAPQAQEAAFKAAAIYAYVRGDIKNARKYFSQLAPRGKELSPYSAAALYQLGLLGQWEGDPGAKEYYAEALKAALPGYAETARLASARLKEAEEGRAMDYNIKKFLDLCFEQASAPGSMDNAGISCRPYRPAAQDEVIVASSIYPAASGCMQVQAQYLWAGDLGENIPPSSQPQFATRYSQPGTKLIFLCVASEQGVIGRAIDFLDVR